MPGPFEGTRISNRTTVPRGDSATEASQRVTEDPGDREDPETPKRARSPSGYGCCANADVQGGMRVRGRLAFVRTREQWPRVMSPGAHVAAPDAALPIVDINWHHDAVFHRSAALDGRRELQRRLSAAGPGAWREAPARNARGLIRAESVGPVRHARQRVGMEQRCLR